MDVKTFVDYQMQVAFGPDALKNRQAGLCIECGQPALEKCYSEAGRREVRISGICEICFDNLFLGVENG